ncbi:alpha/beta fold hydrolase [Nitrospinota bacterium]
MVSENQYRSVWSAVLGVRFTQDWVDAAGVNTRYLNAGSADMPPLLMLHGVVGHAEAFIRNLGAHGKHFNTYALDLLGNGYTDKPPIDYHIPVVADHVRDFMDAMGMDKACILGTSYGSRVAARFVANFPERVEKLTLVSPGGLSYSKEVNGRILEGALRVIDNPTWDVVKANLERFMADPSEITDDYIVTRQAIFRSAEFQEAKYRNLLAHMPETGHLSLISEDEYRSITKPTLVVRGIKGESAEPAMAEKIADLIPGARLVIMKNVGHWPYYEHPEEFNELHLNFLLNG